ncbi:zinc-finger domain-containing protein [Kaustia mangrovi]|uniref:Zinc-finger domain-containing protein n=1 Tax=Kaustia mangrovi TaxID=2593653 RepID=A0A7S8C0R4_9HYPH|nr:zinc-finger domain-containing protein [Kaustia mangrovi]QPC41274.1 zinc-finger domain-containing protein [Kaustia mangrovi]
MADPVVPKFHNDAGVDIVEIGVKEFECMGAAPPHDHPHVYLDMGDETEIICPYCSTVYRYNPALKPEDSKPADAFYRAAHTP